MPHVPLQTSMDCMRDMPYCIQCSFDVTNYFLNFLLLSQGGGEEITHESSCPCMSMTCPFSLHTVVITRNAPKSPYACLCTCARTQQLLLIDHYSMVRSQFFFEETVGWLRWTSLSGQLCCTISRNRRKKDVLTEWTNSLCKMRNKSCKPRVKHNPVDTEDQFWL